MARQEWYSEVWKSTNPGGDQESQGLTVSSVQLQEKERSLGGTRVVCSEGGAQKHPTCHSEFRLEQPAWEYTSGWKLHRM